MEDLIEEIGVCEKINPMLRIEELVEKVLEKPKFNFKSLSTGSCEIIHFESSGAIIMHSILNALKRRIFDVIQDLMLSRSISIFSAWNG